MKQKALLLIFLFINGYPIIAQDVDSMLNAAANSMGNSMTKDYMIFDFQKRSPLSGNYILKNNGEECLIQIDLGSAIQQSINRKLIEEKLKYLQIGTVLTNIKYSNIIYIKSNSSVRYDLLPPKFSQPYIITKMERLVNDSSSYFVTVKETVKEHNATGLTLSYFTTHYTPFKKGDKIYEAPFNSKIYATLADHPGTAGPWYFPVIYEIKITTNPIQNSLVKEVTENAYITQSNIDSNSHAQTQRLNIGTPWDIQVDPTIKGIGGQITLQIPKGLRYNTHMEFYDAGDAKK